MTETRLTWPCHCEEEEEKEVEVVEEEGEEEEEEEEEEEGGEEDVDEWEGGHEDEWWVRMSRGTNYRSCGPHGPGEIPQSLCLM